jgi:protein-tyrosine phosphatase
VCTGNICRSPYAEFLLQQGLDAMAPGEFLVGSAGTMGLRRQPIEEPLNAFLRSRGVDTSDFESRRLSARLLGLADVVVALTAEHRDEILRIAPAALKRTFTLLELAAAAEKLRERAPEYARFSPADRWKEFARQAAIMRPSLNASLETIDIEDPYQRSREVFEKTAQTIEQSVDRILAFERAARAASTR